MKVILFLTALAVLVASEGWTSFKPDDDYKFKGMSSEEFARQYLMPLD